MAGFTLLGDSTTGRTLNTGENGFVGPDAALFVATNRAVTMNNNLTLTVLATVASNTSDAIFSNESARIVVSGGGTVTSVFGSGVVLQGISQHRLTNDGTIQGRNGISWQSTSTNSTTVRSQEITNNGTIIGSETDGVALFVSNDTSTITNTGTIQGGTKGLDLTAASVTDVENDRFLIINSGVITGQAIGAESDHATDKVVNTGEILTGDAPKARAVDLREGDDIFINSGKAVGNVQLGSGSGKYDGRGGTVVGVVSGSTGDDLYIVDDDSTVLVEDGAGGTDEVRSKGDFTLGDHFEILKLIGSADADGTSNDTSNTITGNGGDNRLAGKGGNDTINGGNGEDTLRGGSGNDELLGDNDLLTGDNGG